MTLVNKHTFDYKSFLDTTSERAGIYEMLSSSSEVLYVGKAKNLKKRLSNYFRKHNQTKRIQSLVEQIASIHVTLTSTEIEALLLEQNLIKAKKPRYNILLRDDKSYPFIALQKKHAFPSLYIFRNKAKKSEDQLFGPYIHSRAVYNVLYFIQKIFKIRNCSDSFFENRSRPCLQYQIKRCSAPCVGYIDENEYRNHLEYAVKLIKGKNIEVIKELTTQMNLASQNQDYEQAAVYRDLISDISKLSHTQVVIDSSNIDRDIVVILQKSDVFIVTVVNVRYGNVLGVENYFPHHYEGASSQDILDAFIKQYYLNPLRIATLPQEIVVQEAIEDMQLLSDLLSQKAKRKVIIKCGTSSKYRPFIEMAMENAHNAFNKSEDKDLSYQQSLEEFRTFFNIKDKEVRIECFDISHFKGEATVASCVVFNEQGPLKKDYRQYHVRDIRQGNDYQAIEYTLNKHILKYKTKQRLEPSLLVIDGGEAHLRLVSTLFNKHELSHVKIVAIAKGLKRKSKYDKIFYLDRDITHERPKLTQLIQQIRNEAHRFAITRHRQLRQNLRKSDLESIHGLGPKKRRILLEHFGGMQEILQCTKYDLKKVPGINDILAERIYDYFHNSSLHS